MIDYEPFASLPSSNEFGQCYSPRLVHEPKKQSETTTEVPIKRKRGRPRESEKVAVKIEARQIVTRSSNRKWHFDEISLDDLSLTIRSQEASAMKQVGRFNGKKARSKFSKTRQRQSTFIFNNRFFKLGDEAGQPRRSTKTAQTSTKLTACHVCSNSDRPEVLLLCDDCHDAYHSECLPPILLSAPDGDWFCPLCEQKRLSNFLIRKISNSAEEILERHSIGIRT